MYSDRKLAVAKSPTGNKRRKVDVLKLRTHSKLQQYKDQLHSNLDNMLSAYKWCDITAACSSAAKTSVGKADEALDKRQHVETYRKHEAD